MIVPVYNMYPNNSNNPYSIKPNNPNVINSNPSTLVPNQKQSPKPS